MDFLDLAAGPVLKYCNCHSRGKKHFWVVSAALSVDDF